MPRADIAIVLAQQSGAGTAEILAGMAITKVNGAELHAPLALVAIVFPADDGGDHGELTGFSLDFLTEPDLRVLLDDERLGPEDILFSWDWAHRNHAVELPRRLAAEAEAVIRGAMAGGLRDGLDAKAALFDDVARRMVQRQEALRLELAPSFSVFAVRSEDPVNGAVQSILHSGGPEAVRGLAELGVLP